MGTTEAPTNSWRVGMAGRSRYRAHHHPIATDDWILSRCRHGMFAFIRAVACVRETACDVCGRNSGKGREVFL